MADILFEGDPYETPKPRGRQRSKTLFEGDPYADPKSGMKVRPIGNRDSQTLFNGPVESGAKLPDRGAGTVDATPDIGATKKPSTSREKKPSTSRDRHNTSDIYYHTQGRSQGRSLNSTLSIIGIVVMALIFLYWILATKNGANNFWGKINALVAPTGKILSSKPMFRPGQSQIFTNTTIPPPSGSTTNGSSMQQTTSGNSSSSSSPAGILGALGSLGTLGGGLPGTFI